jgi:hypothetical protein
MPIQLVSLLADLGIKGRFGYGSRVEHAGER